MTIEKGVVPSEIARNLAEADVFRAEAELFRARAAREGADDRFAATRDFLFNHLNFCEDIDEDTAHRYNTALRQLQRLNPGQPIEVNLTSPGGCIVSGFSMYDETLRIIRQGSPVTLTVRGEACSMAAVLLQAASHRQIGPNSRIMLHNASFAPRGTSDKVEDDLKEVRALEAHIHKLLGDRTGKPAAYWKRRLGQRKDQWWSAEEALAEGLVDAIA